MTSVRNKDGIWINSAVFTEEALHFRKYGYYCTDPYGSPAWAEYWEEQTRRIIYGYESAGAKITGDHYFYLNFCPILKTEEQTENKKRKRAKKVTDFPNFWDGDYEFFWSRAIARDGIAETLLEDTTVYDELTEEQQQKRREILLDSLYMNNKISKDSLDGGLNLIIGKSRRKGYSYKNAAIGVKNYITIPESTTIYGAYEKKFLYPKGTFTMCRNYINFLNDNTAWAMPSDYIDRADHVKASYTEYKNGIELEKGFRSEIMALTFKDNPDAARGKDAVDIIFEESGAFGTPGLLLDSYAASEDCVKDGDIKTGMITIFGCVCKGTKVWNHKGIPTNIEDITKETGIIGYASIGTINENISWLQPPSQKECVRITTENGSTIECSTDHPLLYTNNKHKPKNSNRKATFQRAEDLNVGDYLLQVSQVPKFGDKRMWNPRLVGLLIGDGYYGTKYASSQIAISEPEILEYFDDNNIKYSIYEGKSSEIPFFRYITLKATQEELRLLGIQGQSCKSKRLPNNIWDYNAFSVSEMLGGIFDADGSIEEQGNRKKISLSSVVPELLEEMKIQLYKLGIESKIYTRKHKPGTLLKSNVTGKTSIINTTTSYSLEICDLRSIRNFKKHIHFIIKKKQALLDSWDLSIRPNEDKQEYEYNHTIEKGDFFKVNSKLEYLSRTKIINIERIGLQDIYNLSAEYTHTYITNGFISHNTSGDMEGGTADYAHMYFHPEKFGLLPFEDVWEGEDRHGQKEGFFHPVNLNMNGFIDENGNSDLKGAKDNVLSGRSYLIEKGANTADMQRKIQEKPLTPSEAFAYTNINVFPKKELEARKLYLIAKGYDKLKAQPVNLFRDPDTHKVVSQPDLSGKLQPITSMNYEGISIEGAPVIYEYPMPNSPRGLYKIGYDPVRQDLGTSLCAIIVYKGVLQGSYTRDCIVAEYIGRKLNPDDNHLVAEMFAELYNTQVMYENEVPDVKTYFTRRRLLHLLALQPDAVINKSVKKSTVARVYGCHMTPQLKDAGERYINTWLKEVIDFDENNMPITNLDRINSLRLIEELLQYNKKGNFDLISSLIMCMFQVQEEVLGKEYKESCSNKSAKKLLSMMNNLHKNNNMY